MNKVYLGDGVYLDRNEYGELVLTTEDGIRTTNTIVLDYTVVKTLVQWMKREIPEMMNDKR